jgi:hypothetical protein
MAKMVNFTRTRAGRLLHYETNRFHERSSAAGEKLRAVVRRVLQSYARASAVLVDELDAGGYQACGRYRNRRAL